MRLQGLDWQRRTFPPISDGVTLFVGNVSGSSEDEVTTDWNYRMSGYDGPSVHFEARTMRILGSTCLLLAVMTCGCAGTAGTDDDSPATEWTDAQREAEIERRTEARRQLAERQPERVPAEEPAPVTGEVPEELLDAIREDLAQRLGIETEDLEPVRAASVNWNDGSLGCPEPDQVYTQAITPGYHIVFEIDDTSYDYRAKRNGFFMLCELPVLTRPSQPIQ